MVENLILILLVLVWSCLCIIGGFFYAQKARDKPVKQPPKIDEQTAIKAKRVIREYTNFFNYDGTEQNDINL